MDFSFSKEQTAYQADVRQFAKAAGLDAEPGERAEGPGFNREAWQKCAGFGIQGGLVPEEHGGRGLDLVTFIGGLESLGTVCRDNGLLFAMCAQIFACELPLLSFGSDEQRARWLPGLCDGSLIGAIAIAEEHGASDAFAIQTTAREEGNTFLLNGRKAYVTNAPFCNLALVFARVEDAREIGCFVVEQGTPGFLQEPPTAKMGMSGGPFGALAFENCRVPAAHRLGSRKSGELIFVSAMEWERGCLLAPMVGGMQRILDQCIAWVRTREQQGASLSKKQAVAHRVADMRVRVESARWMLYGFAWKKQVKRRANLEASMAKLFISEAAVANALDALTLHGAYGYTQASGIEREVRDMLATPIASGTSDIQRNIIAKWLRL